MRVLARVDQAAAAGETTTIGPFAVFGAAPSGSPAVSEVSEGQGLMVDGQCSSTGVEDLERLSVASAESIHEEGSGCAGPDGDFGYAELEQNFGNLHQEGDLTADTSSSTGGSDDTDTTIVPARPTSQLEVSLIPRGFDIAPFHDILPICGMPQVNQTATMLIQHYAKSMVHLMQPIVHESSPFEKIYLPLAIAGSANLNGIGRVDQSTSPSASVCHSILSTAASNLRSLGSGVPGLQALAWQHKQKALTTLRIALITRTSTYRELMVAILSLVSADLLNGGVDDHYIHLEAARQLQASRHFPTIVSRETRQLDSICKMLRLFAQTTLHNPEPEQWPGSNITFRESDVSTLSPSIEYLYGITLPTAGTIMKTYRLTQMLAHYQQASAKYPDELSQACEDLGDELASWSASPETFSAIGTQNAQMLSIAQAQAAAFAAAARIYYFRSVQFCRREDLHEEQDEVLVAMNEAEDLKATLGGAVSMPAPITWPAFVASCEAVGEARAKWDAWWCRIQRYQMKSYQQQSRAVHQVWARLDEQRDPCVDWREVLVALNIRILPV